MNVIKINIVYVLLLQEDYVLTFNCKAPSISTYVSGIVWGKELGTGGKELFLLEGF